MLAQAMELGHLEAGWVAGDDAFGMSPSFRPFDKLRRTGGLGYAVRAGRSGRHHGLAFGAGLDQSGISGVRASPQTRLRDGQRRTMEQRSDELPDEAWREITVAEGSQGPRTYRFSAQRVRVTRRRKPGEIHWAVYRRNLDGSEPRYYLSNAPEDTTLETLAYVGGSRWRIETEFETEKGELGLDEYETRSWAGWHHHIAMCLLGGAFLLGLQQDWGKKMPRITRPQVYRVVREMLPRERFGPDQLLLWLEDTQLRNERARRSHERRRSARCEGRMDPPP